MNVNDFNKHLLADTTASDAIFARLTRLRSSRFVFNFDFGLSALPTEAGIIIVRGARQVGKSTWLDLQIQETRNKFGPGSALYLNGDEIVDVDALVAEIRLLLPLFRPSSPVRRIFIDEITAVQNWERGLKRLADSGEISDVLVVTTGSKANDLRRGTERLPGRKGRLDRTAYIFTPIPFREFRRVCGEALGSKLLPAYIISGGSPIACSELAATGTLPEYVIATTRDWINGEIAASGRDRSSLLAIIELLYRYGGTPVGFAKLARESGLANNTVAQGYIEVLSDLLVVSPCFFRELPRGRVLRRRPCKFHFTNLLAAVAWHPARIRSITDYETLSPEQQGILLEWAVAQERFRRRAIRGEEIPELLCFWNSKEHEIDFVENGDSLTEVKRGSTTPLDFAWFPKTVPKDRLLVISKSTFETSCVQSVTLETYLLSENDNEE